jgi:serine/threonine protein kinase
MGLCASGDAGGQDEVTVNPTHIDDTHFEMLKVVDAGAFGKVNAVVRKIDKKILAMKRINKANIAGDKHAIKRLKRERDFMILFNHPFVMKLYHVYQNQHEILFVMPFMSGGSLAFHLKKFLYR